MNTTTVPRVRRRTPLLFALLLALLTTGLVMVGARPAYADTTLCSGYDWTTCPSAGYTDHGYGAHNGTSYWGAFTGHNCTNYAAYMEQVVNGATTSTSGNAADWDNNAPAGTVNTTPGLGSVAQWEVSTLHPSGHVAYVESVNSDGSITVSEDNWSTGPFKWEIISPGSSNWPNHFIHFKDLARMDDFVIYRASGGTGYWYVKQNQNGYAGPYLVNGWTHGGWSGDIPFTADFNGDGIADFGIYRLVNSSGTWYVEDGVDHHQLSNMWGVVHGSPGDVPVVGDFDGDGKADYGIFRLVNGTDGTWYIKSSATGNPTAIWGAVHGSPGDVPIVGDFNGDHYADFGIYRVVNGTGCWYVKSGATGQQIPSAWGVMHGGWAQDVPVVGDFNGDGYTDFGIYRPIDGTGYWYVKSGVNVSTMLVNGVTQGGWAGDVPLAGNFG